MRYPMIIFYTECLEQDEAALECFKKSAALGNRFAKQQTVALNPYAAMCNQMLSELFTKVKEGQA